MTHAQGLAWCEPSASENDHCLYHHNYHHPHHHHCRGYPVIVAVTITINTIIIRSVTLVITALSLCWEEAPFIENLAFSKPSTKSLTCRGFIFPTELLPRSRRQVLISVLQVTWTQNVKVALTPLFLYHSTSSASANPTVNLVPPFLVSFTPLMKCYFSVRPSQRL